VLRSCHDRDVLNPLADRIIDVESAGRQTVALRRRFRIGSSAEDSDAGQ
jgi:hypothetical protein